MKTAIVVIDMQNDFVTGSLGRPRRFCPASGTFLRKMLHPLLPPMSSSLRTRILKTISKRRKAGVFRYLTASEAAGDGTSAKS